MRARWSLGCCNPPSCERQDNQGWDTCWLVAIAYILHKLPWWKVKHDFKQNVQVLDISLSAEKIQHMDNAKPFDLGFLSNFHLTLTSAWHSLGYQEAHSGLRSRGQVRK